MGYDINSILLAGTGATEALDSAASADDNNETFPSSFSSFLVSAWYWPDGNNNLQLGAFTSALSPPLNFFGFNVVVRNSGGSPSFIETGDGSALEAASNLIQFTNVAWNLDAYMNVLCSCDVATQTAQIYINDVPLVISSHSWVQSSIHSRSGGLFATAGHALIDFTCMGDVYIAATNTFFDLSITSNRRKFIDQYGYPVDLGTSASGPTGASPQVYLSVRTPGAASEMLINRGTGGHNFQVRGTGSPVIGVCVELPLPPSPFCGAVHTNTSFTAAWSPNPFGGTPDAYDVQYRVQGTEDWTFLNNITDEFVLITGLANTTVYEFQVAALRENNPSDFSASAYCSTGTPPIVQPVPQSLGRWRGQVGLNWKGMALVGDAYDNVVGLSDFNTFTEYGNTMRFLVTTPPVQDDRKRIFVSRFELEVESGQGNPDDPDVPPVIILDVSKDGGITFISPQVFRSMGAIGEYVKRLRWLNLGVSRTWVFRIQCTDPVRRYIIGSYIDDYKGLG